MLPRIAKYSIKNILRNKFLSISSVLVLTLLMFFINILVILDDISYKLIESINSRLTISLYLDSQYSNTSLEVTDFMENIKKIKSSIIVEYKTKDDILNDLRLKEPNLVKILERSNPLPDTIVLSNIGLSDYSRVNSLIEEKGYLLSNNESQENYFANYSTQYKKIQDVTNILDILKLGLNIIIFIFIFSIAIIIYSVIGNFIYYYRDEIYITKLVGGSNVFIYGPFVLQGIIFSAIAFIFNLVLFTLLLNNLNTLFGHIYVFSFSNIVLILEFSLFSFIGGISGYFSSKRYLK